MRVVAWWLCGLVALAITQGLMAQQSVAHLAPNVVWVVTAFVALRQPLRITLLVCLPLGYAQSVSALAPPGVIELSMCVVAIGVALASGNLAARGLSSFVLALVTGDMALSLCQAALLMWQRFDVGFSSWATAMLLPEAAITALVGTLFYGPLCALEKALLPRVTEGLTWR